jgi:hypothetical protein
LSTVHIQQEHNLARRRHFAAFIGMGLCQLPSAAMSTSVTRPPKTGPEIKLGIRLNWTMKEVKYAKKTLFS